MRERADLRGVRYLSLVVLFGAGVYFATGHSLDFLGRPFGGPYLGGFLILVAVLGLLGVNVWMGGFLDKRSDSKRTDGAKPPGPLLLIAIVPPEVEKERLAAAIEEAVVPACRSGTFIYSLLNPTEARFQAVSFVFGDVRDARTIGEGLSGKVHASIRLIAVLDWREIGASWHFADGRLVEGYARDPENLGAYAEVLPVRKSDSCVEESFRGSPLGFIGEADIMKLMLASGAEKEGGGEISVRWRPE